jgi:hypothetical protein
MNIPEGVCGAQRKSGRYTWVCIMPIHRSMAASAPEMDRMRRGQGGKPVKADKHVFIRVGRGIGQSAAWVARARRADTEGDGR